MKAKRRPMHLSELNLTTFTTSVSFLPSIALISTSIIARMIFSSISSCSQVESLQFHGALFVLICSFSKFIFVSISFLTLSAFFLLLCNPFDVVKKKRPMHFLLFEYVPRIGNEKCQSQIKTTKSLLV